MPYYLLTDMLMLWMLSFLLASIFIALFVIIRAFCSPYKDRKDEMHYHGMKKYLLREAESLARELSYGE